jgi:hypothetical protein
LPFKRGERRGAALNEGSWGPEVPSENPAEK